MLCRVDGRGFVAYANYRGNKSEIIELKMPNLGVLAREVVYTEAYQEVNWSQLTALRKITVAHNAMLIGLNLTTNIPSLKEIDFQSVTLDVDALENLLEHAPNLKSFKHEGCEYLMLKSANTGKRAILEERIRKINLGVSSAQTTPDSMIRGSAWDQVLEIDSQSDYDEYQQSIEAGGPLDTWRGRLNSFGSNSSISGVREFAHRDGSVDSDAGLDFTSSSAESDNEQLDILFQEDQSSRKSEEVQSRRSLSNSLGGQQEYIEPNDYSVSTENLGEYFGYEREEHSGIEIICVSKDGSEKRLSTAKDFNDLDYGVRSEIITVKISCYGTKVNVVALMDFSNLFLLEHLEITGALISEVAEGAFALDGSLKELSIKDCVIDESGIENFINGTRSSVVSQIVTLANVTPAENASFTQSTLDKFLEHFSGNKKVRFLTGRAISSAIDDTDEYDNEEFDETSSQGTEIEVGIGPTPAHVEKRASRTGIKTSQSGGSAAGKSAVSSLSDSNLQHLRDKRISTLERLLGGSQSSVKGVENDVRPFSEDGSELHSDPDHSSAGRSESAKGETANIQISYSGKTHSKAATLSNGDVLPSSLDVEELPSGPKTRTRSNSYPLSRKESKLRVSDSSSNLDHGLNHGAGVLQINSSKSQFESEMGDAPWDGWEYDSESSDPLIVPEYGGVRRLNPHGSSISKGKHGDQVRTVSLWQSLGRKLRQNTLHQEALESSQKAGASRDNQSQIRQLGRLLNAGKSESDVGSEVDGFLSSSSTPTHRSLRDLGQRGNTFGSETNKQPFFSRTGAGVLHTGENLETSRSTGSNIRSQYQLLRLDFDIQAEGRVEERPVAKIADEIDKVLGENLELKYYTHFDVQPFADESKVTLLHKAIPVLEARSESVKVFKSLRNVSELNRKQKALVVLGSLGIPPCPEEGIHVDTKGKENDLAKEINKQFDCLFKEQYTYDNPNSPEHREFTVRSIHKSLKR